MTFQQLLQIIPLIEHIESHSASIKIDCPADQHLLVLVRRGHIKIQLQDGEPIVCSQAYACHPDLGPFYIQAPKTKEVEYVVFTYRLLPEQSTWTLHGPLTTISDYKINYMVDELIRTTQNIHPHSIEEEAAQQFRKRLMFERILFIYLYESHMTYEKKSSAESIEETLSYMNEHYMVALTLPMLARRAGMSTGHYTVLFKKRTGTTMTSYLHTLRIEKAKLLLLQSDLLAKEVAQRVGYVDYFHFSKVFKKMTGCSPATFQETKRTSKN
ncbi:helix-turn-helix transcriptional regulator [Paenibacillus sp. SYP-B3998]|uniref:Helix-turn-helix transcriptional regulator n=1 Tax=Paenibacillus sp. SYP-B3998 TaxID=2678564 RepID=A0A6G4A2Q2_9BACL|nr:AraC family transcriptional regulator [Paenibacillus sp. SYP-B3998]NEW07927.1 helix-turn-helix transcriptional regulator [Paenibacillus sp. SYP-B3998]